ncbi:MAG: hypothetical protein C4320_06270, partial [Armatimonadota bacterium]
MSSPGTPETESFADKMEGMITSVARAAAILGAILTVASLVAVAIITTRVAGDPTLAKQAAANLEPFAKALTGGLVLFLAGTAAMFWSSEIMLFGHAVLAAALWL